MLHYLFIDIVTQADATTDRHAGSKEVDGPVFLQAGPVTDGLLGIYPKATDRQDADDNERTAILICFCVTSCRAAAHSGQSLLCFKLQNMLEIGR